MSGAVSFVLTKSNPSQSWSDGPGTASRSESECHGGDECLPRVHSTDASSLFSAQPRSRASSRRRSIASAAIHNLPVVMSDATATMVALSFEVGP